jgi:hypothetical protein
MICGRAWGKDLATGLTSEDDSDWEVELKEQAKKTTKKKQVVNDLALVMDTSVEQLRTKYVRQTKGKKGKKGKKVKKGKKGKKGKPLPGGKYCKYLKLGQMVELLVENEILKNWGVNHERAGKPPPSISDMQGAFDFLGHIKLAQLNSTRAPTGDKWCMPPDPSYAQVRQNLTEYAVLPNGSPFVKQQTPLVRSVLLCGPSGVGKTMLVESVARHLNAIILDLSV